MKETNTDYLCDQLIAHVSIDLQNIKYIHIRPDGQLFMYLFGIIVHKKCQHPNELCITFRRLGHGYPTGVNSTVSNRLLCTPLEEVIQAEPIRSKDCFFNVNAILKYVLHLL